MKINDFKPNTDVTFGCVIHNVKQMGSQKMIMVRAGRYLIQAIYNSKYCVKDSDLLKSGSYINMTGTVTSDKRAVNGFEIKIKDYDVLNEKVATLPLHLSAKSLDCDIEEKINERLISIRHPEEKAIFPILSKAVSGFRNALDDMDFTEIFTPKLSDEGELKCEYFGHDAYLTKSQDFYLQSACSALGDVYEIYHAYSGKRHNSRRHLNEYTMLACEKSYVTSLSELLELETKVVSQMLETISSECEYEINFLDLKIDKINEIPIIKFSDAISILGKKRVQYDLDPTDEVRLHKYSKEKFDNDFIFVTEIPLNNQPKNFTEVYVLLYKGMEISNGGIHNHLYKNNTIPRYDKLLSYGIMPMGGFEIWLERFIMQLTNSNDIRNCSMFPRDIHTLTP